MALDKVGMVLTDAQVTPAVADLNVVAQAVNNNRGVVNLSNGILYNVFVVPSSITWTVASNNGGGAVSTTVYGFNNNSLNAAVTTNGSGAASITNTYGDGFSGKVYEQLSRTCNAGQGLLIKGFTIQATNYTSGAQISTPFSQINLTVITANGQGSTIPLTIDLSEALRNTQYQVGILTVNKGFYLNAMTQLQLNLPANTQLVFTMFTDASGFNG